MRTFVRNLMLVVMVVFASMAAVTIATPAANVCRPLGVGPQPLGCDNGWWWDPAANVCRPPLVPLAG